MAVTGIDNWEYARWVYIIGRSLRFNLPSTSEQTAADTFIAALTANRPWLEPREQAKQAAGGNLNNDEFRGEMIAVIGRTAMKLHDGIVRSLIAAGIAPNAITVAGFVLTGVAAVFLVIGAGHAPPWEAGRTATPASLLPLIAAIVLILAGACDILDGGVARAGATERGDDPETDDEEFAVMNWKDWETGDIHTVSYLWYGGAGSLQQLKRKTLILDRYGTEVTNETTLVADNIYSANLTAQEQLWKLFVQTCVRDEMVTKDYEIRKRY